MTDDVTRRADNQWLIVGWQEELRHLLRQHTGQAWDVRAAADGVGTTNVQFTCLWLGVAGSLMCSWRRVTPQYFTGAGAVGIEEGIKIDAEQMAVLWRKDIQRLQVVAEGCDK